MYSVGSSQDCTALALCWGTWWVRAPDVLWDPQPCSCWSHTPMSLPPLKTDKGYVGSSLCDSFTDPSVCPNFLRLTQQADYSYQSSFFPLSFYSGRIGSLPTLGRHLHPSQDSPNKSLLSGILSWSLLLRISELMPMYLFITQTL